MLVLNFPIEPMENRYSIQWDKWFREAFTRNKIEFVTITGHKIAQNAPKDGFNNPITSMKFKFSQLEQAINILVYRDEPTVIFLQDGWMPGTEAFQYIRAIQKRNVKVAAFWHAGSYLGTDILNEQNQSYWAEHSEKSWLRLASKVFLGSEYHRDKMLVGCDLYDREGKFVITGCPVQTPDCFTTESWGKIVVFPHRLSNDKHPEIFDKLAAEPRFKNVQFIKSLEKCKTKDEYYNLLGHSQVAVSVATHETFGISMVEASQCGCHCVVPDSLSYRELFDERFRYSTYEQLVEKVEEGLKYNPKEPHPTPWEQGRSLDRFDQQVVTDHICKEIKGMFDE